MPAEVSGGEIAFVAPQRLEPLEQPFDARLGIQNTGRLGAVADGAYRLAQPSGAKPDHGPSHRLAFQRGDAEVLDAGEHEGAAIAIDCRQAVGRLPAEEADVRRRELLQAALLGPAADDPQRLP